MGVGVGGRRKVVRCLLLVFRQLDNLIYSVHIQASEKFSETMCSSSRLQSTKAAASIGCQQVPFDHSFHDKAS